MKRLILFLLFLSLKNYAGDVYVDVSNPGPGDGTIGNPYNTISDGKTALNALGDGAHTLHIKGGTYTESNIAFTRNGTDSSNPVLITFWSGSGPVIISAPATVAYVLLLNGNYEKLDGSSGNIIITNAIQGGVRINGDNCVVDGVTIRNSANSASGVCGIRAYQAGSYQVLNCDIEAYKKGMFIEDSTGTPALPCVISNTIVSAKVYSGGSGYIIHNYQSVSNVQNFIVSGCTLTVDDIALSGANDFVGIGGGVAGGGNWYITNSTISNLGSPAFYDGSSGVLITDLTNSMVSNCTVENWGEYGIDVGGSSIQSQGITIQRNTVKNCGRGNIAVDGDTTGETTPINVINNISVLSVAPPGGSDYNGGFDTHADSAANNSHIRWLNNTHWTDQTSQYACGFWSDNNGGTSTFELINNIFYVTGGVGIKFQNTTAFTGPTVTISNNCIFVSGAGLALKTGFGLTLTNYDAGHVIGGSTGYFTFDSGKGQNSVTNNPNLNSDYTENFVSPTRNVGVDLSAIFTTDKSGTTRIVPWDIGAYEYTSRLHRILWR